MKQRALAAALLAAVALTGCTEAGISGGGSGYVSGNGYVTEVPVTDRGEPIVFEGITEEGAAWSSADHPGVTLVNFWYASCPPCRTEAPILAELSAEFEGRVTFVGVNVRDGADQARSFHDTFGIEFPSLMDAEGAKVQLAFSGEIPPNAVPTTIILDAEGRVAARISGAIADRSIVSTLLREELER